MNSIGFAGEELYPSKVVCVGRNYVEHIRELGNEISEEIVIFMKPNSAISTHINLEGHDAVHYEAELTFLVQASKISAVAIGLDLTKREIQSRLKSKGLPWERAKSFDNSAVVGDFVSHQGDCDGLRLELFVNGELRQAGGCDMMLHKPETVLQEVLGFITLEDGDLVMTGTPKGVGVVRPGAEFIGKIYNNNELLVENKWIV